MPKPVKPMVFVALLTASPVAVVVPAEGAPGTVVSQVVVPV